MVVNLTIGVDAESPGAPSIARTMSMIVPSTSTLRPSHARVSAYIQADVARMTAPRGSTTNFPSASANLTMRFIGHSLCQANGAKSSALHCGGIDVTL
jgi:hypothetical protein